MATPLPASPASSNSGQIDDAALTTERTDIGKSERVPRRPARARLEDVAREAGVSLSTASRALRGQAGVRQDMADRVRAAAIAVGYKRRVRDGMRARSPAARVAKPRIADRVVVLTPAADADTLAVPKLLEGVALTLRGAGLEPVFTDDPADCPPPAPRGVIAVHVVDKSTRTAIGPSARVVNVGHAPGGKADAVVADDFGGMHGVVARALALGHRRVAVITGPSQHSSSRTRKRAVVAAFDEAALARSHATWREAGWSVDDGYEASRSFLAPKPSTGSAARRRTRISGPALVVCSHDLQALGVMRAAREMGLRVPRDVSVTGFGGIAAGPGFRLTVTSARVDPYAMGVVAAERLIEVLRTPSGLPRTIVLPTEPVAGQTLAFPRRR